EGDLVLATHGRSFWVLDDLGPVRQLQPHTAEQSAVLVKPRTAVRYMSNSGFSHKPTRGKNYRMPGTVMVTYRQREDPRTGAKENVYLDAGRNPPDGAIVSYFLREKPDGDITLTFLEADGREIRTFSSKNVEEPEPSDETAVGEGAEDVTQQRSETPRKQKEPRIPKEAGLNRFVWNLRYPEATKIEDDEVANDLVEDGAQGPIVPPGRYRVRLTVGDSSPEEEFEVQTDPRVAVPEADFAAQFELLMQVRDKLSVTHGAVNKIRALRKRVEDWASRARDKPELSKVASAATAVVERLKPIEAELIQVKAVSRGDTLNFPVRLNGKLAVLAGGIASGDGAPTQAQRGVFSELSQRVDRQVDLLDEVVATEVDALNNAIQAAGLPPVGI
ncbi:MAG TPA: glycosyl hydrolase, partial [Chloroflexota bacterium]|nr:glycosyl hydrolase [Chloroflexota bacterium]